MNKLQYGSEELFSLPL